MDSPALSKVKSEPNLDEDEAADVLSNGILIETGKGLLCMSLNDALSLDSNLSADALRNVAARLISQQNVIPSNKFINASLSCDSDGFSSECSDISTTTSGSSAQSTYIISSLSNEISNVFNYEGIFNRPKIVSVASDKTVSASKKDIKIEQIEKNIKGDGENSNSKTLLEAGKPKKGRGGWPKGRKRKPELLNLPPKAPATGYNLYLNEQRKLFKNSSLAFHEITKIIGNRWSSLTLDEKKPYLEKAEEDKKRYREELKQYRQSDAYRAYLNKKRKKRLQNNVLSESDMDATDDFDEEDNEELYCRTCDQWFHNLHNKREHLQGKQHIQSVAGDINRELASDKEVSISLNTSLDESSLDGLPNLKTGTSCSTIYDAMTNLAAMVSKRENEIKVLQNRRQEAIWQQQALSRQLYQLTERHKKLQKDLVLLKDKEKDMEDKVFHLWQVPSWFIITDFNTDSATEFTESTE